MKKLLLALSIASLSFFGICSAGSKNKNKETTVQPTTYPIVFVNFRALYCHDKLQNGFDDKYPISIELNEIQKHIDKINKQLNEVEISTEKVNELYKTIDELYSLQYKMRNKFKIVTKNIAKSLNAYAALDLSCSDQVIDQASDITAKVIDQLNKEYLESIKTCPTCNQSINNN